MKHIFQKTHQLLEHCEQVKNLPFGIARKTTPKNGEGIPIITYNQDYKIHHINCVETRKYEKIADIASDMYIRGSPKELGVQVNITLNSNRGVHSLSQGMVLGTYCIDAPDLQSSAMDVIPERAVFMLFDLNYFDQLYCSWAFAFLVLREKNVPTDICREICSYLPRWFVEEHPR